MIGAVGRVPGIDRRGGRERGEKHFSPHAMAQGYERAYSAVISSAQMPPIGASDAAMLGA